MTHRALSWNEFHISGELRRACGFDETLAASTGNVVLVNPAAARSLCVKLNETLDSDKKLSAGSLNAMAVIDEALHYCCAQFRADENPASFSQVYAALCDKLGQDRVLRLLEDFTGEFPPRRVYRGEATAAEYLSGSGWDESARAERPNTEQALEELILLKLGNENPAFAPFRFLFNDENLAKNGDYAALWDCVKEEFKKQPIFGPYKNDLITMLKEPVVFSPFSLKGQLDYIRTHWGKLFYAWFRRLFSALDIMSEEEKPGWGPGAGAPDMAPYTYNSFEYERFSADREWMPRVVLLAKMALVWMAQLSRKYGREISRLDHIPDEELDIIAGRGFTGLWLIGLWERSPASRRIKNLCGNPEAAASAYSLMDYDIAWGLGGWDALGNLRERLWRRGVRLAADMVPNHTGIDSKWVVERPDLFMTARDNPFPQYTFSGENLSSDGRVSIVLEDHYYSKTDCAVVFKRVDNATGDTRYIYHGNDGTGLPWNDTAQIDFLNPQAREEVIQKILHVARNFPIIRFDAAMVLVKKHIRRLWYPAPGRGGDIASRAEYALSDKEFESRIPGEFWREVVDRIAAETPDTLLLAEAFWMLEGYFVRTLGMHRVYNSAFMNMLKKEENQKYKQTIKNTIDFDPEILKRFVNFMNNPDEETAEAQFGRGDKYFGICTMMVTMPGLPMFGHGQIEGFTEKYGMEYTRDYRNETPDGGLIGRHEREIFPLMKKRWLFSGIENFLLFDLRDSSGVNENVFAYANRSGEERAFVFYNNAYQSAAGWITESYPFTPAGAEQGRKETRSAAFAMGLSLAENEYVIFRETRRGLSFIRKGTEIRGQGLYVELQGYECQVLMDFSRVQDDETGKYALLWRSLAGRGAPDIQEELEEVFLKDLLSAYERVLSRDFLTDFRALAGGGVQAAPADKRAARGKLTRRGVFEALEADARAFFTVCAEFLGGNYGAAAVLPGGKQGAASAGGSSTVRIGGDKLWRKLRARLTRLLRLWKSSGAPDSFPCIFETLAAFCVLYSLKDIAGPRCTAEALGKLIRLWALDRRTVRALSGISLALAPEARRAVDAVMEGLPLATRLFHPDNPQADALYLARRLVTSERAPRVLGVNRFNDVTWFNKEGYEETTAALVLTQALFARKNQPRERAVVGAALTAAGEASEYKVEKLIALLSPKKPETPPAQKPDLCGKF
ncbi:MAG: alpha-amylase [Spirochaetaceae bacterium]|jgi:glycosidase|nr:alpha-amylase [Spirochaetaceae bacterium]